MTENQLKEELAKLDLQVAPECLSMLTSRKTVNPENRCQLALAYEMRKRASNVEKDYQENEAKRRNLQDAINDGLMNDHHSIGKIVVYLRGKLSTPGGPALGEFTGRFTDVADLVVYFLETGDRPWAKWWQFWR